MVIKTTFLHLGQCWKQSVLALAVLALSACGESEEVNAVAASDAKSKAIASMVVDLPEPVSAVLPAVSDATVTASAAAVPTMIASTPSSLAVREFNPADFPDACNDYIDEVLQCIKVMEQSGMEGTASMQMQLSEMQASWLKETDQKALNQTCQLSLMDIAPVLQDLGC